MAQISFQSGMKFAQALQKALGLDGHPLQRIVIECAVDSIPRVYIKGIVTKEACERVADALAAQLVHCKDVHVEDDGAVIADDPVVIEGKEV